MLVLLISCCSNELGVGLLEKGAPELVRLVRMEKGEATLVHGQPVVDHNIDPLAETPELEVKDACRWERDHYGKRRKNRPA